MTENNSESHVITANALTRKRADILFEIAESEKHVEELRTQLIHLDAVLRMFRPDFKAEELPVRHRRPTKSPYFAHGEMTQRIYDALRESETATSADIAAKAMYAKGLNPEHDEPTKRDFVRRFTMQLRDMARKGNVVKAAGRGPVTRWRLATEVSVR